MLNETANVSRKQTGLRCDAAREALASQEAWHRLSSDRALPCQTSGQEYLPGRRILCSRGSTCAVHDQPTNDQHADTACGVPLSQSPHAQACFTLDNRCLIPSLT